MLLAKYLARINPSHAVGNHEKPPVVSSMIVSNLNVEDASLAPDETDSPVLVDPETVLPGSITPQRFESIAGGGGGPQTGR